jgi:hypothetical protein
LQIQASRREDSTYAAGEVCTRVWCRGNACDLRLAAGCAGTELAALTLNRANKLFDVKLGRKSEKPTRSSSGLPSSSDINTSLQT